MTLAVVALLIVAFASTAGAVLIARSVVVDDEPLPRFYVLPLLVLALAGAAIGARAFRLRRT